MRLDSLIGGAFMNTLRAASTVWNTVTGNCMGWPYSGSGHSRSYSDSPAVWRQGGANAQPSRHMTLRYMGPPPGQSPLASTRPQRVNHINYVFNINYVSVGDVKASQVGVHVNSGHHSMNNGNFGNYGNNGNSGQHNHYANLGDNGHHQRLLSAGLTDNHRQGRV
ncbi:hypothetical protein PFWH6_1253 [Pseudomonas fluorescens WH6]|nr:hypothetical protein PFWH6_1253 [Pseudomonas fluorescens WH6]